MRTITLATFAAALALSACSEKTKDSASEAATSAGVDISDAATDVHDAASEGADKVGVAVSKAEEAADKLGARIKQGAHEAKDTLKSEPSEQAH